jgi:hypothetical protein
MRAWGVQIGIWRAYIHGTLWLRRQWQNVRTRAYHSSEFLHDRQLHNPPESPTAHVRAYIHTGHVTPTVFARTHCADRPDPRDEMDHSRAQPAHGRRQLRPLYVRFGRRGQAGWVCRRGPMQQRGAGVRRSTQRGWMRASENSAATCSATAPPCHNATPVRTETSGVKARSGAEGRGQGSRGRSFTKSRGRAWSRRAGVDLSVSSDEGPRSARWSQLPSLHQYTQA